MRLAGGILIGVALAASGLGVGRGQPPSIAPSTVRFGTGGNIKSTFIAPRHGVVVSAQWVTILPGAGAGDYLAHLQVNTVTQCTVTVPCAGAAGTEVAQACAIEFEEGDDIDWVADGTGCVAGPEGALTYVVQNF